MKISGHIQYPGTRFYGLKYVNSPLTVKQIYVYNFVFRYSSFVRVIS